MRAGGAVLAIDTATPVIGVALWRGDALVREWSARSVRGADALLLPALAEIGRLGADDLRTVAVSVGPGSFTGLRVGLAAALGFAVARGVPVIGLSSLLVRAALVRGPRILALIDAKKGRFYGGLFEGDGEGTRPLGPEADLPIEALLDLEPGFVAVGEGAVVAATRIAAAGGRVAPEADRSPAAALARLAAAAPEPGLAPREVALRYLRAPDARLPGSE